MDEIVDAHREERDHTLVDIEDATRRLMTCMTSRLQNLSHVSQESCIFRVPKTLRDINEGAFFPRLVSIGPFHHGNESLQAMEEHKWRCFNSFIERNVIDLEGLIRFMKGKEREAKEFYAEPIQLSSDQFVQVILVDAIFVITILLQLGTPSLSNPVRSIYHDSFILSKAYRDMLLLENQLPFFILKEILDFAKTATGSGISDECSILKLTRCFLDFSEAAGSGTGDMSSISVERVAANLNSSEIRHFIDFLRLCHLPAKKRRKPQHEGELKQIKSLTELHEAGVQFKLASSKQLLDIQFEDGILEIPGIYVEDRTETIFRNLLAYEQCHCGSSYFGDYILLMDGFINTNYDVELLVKNGILRSSLADNQEVSKLFNNLAKEIYCYTFLHYYSRLREELDDYCRVRCYKWKATLKHNYLNTPWAVLSVFAASILIILTLIQTVCAIISL